MENNRRKAGLAVGLIASAIPVIFSLFMVCPAGQQIEFGSFALICQQCRDAALGELFCLCALYPFVYFAGSLFAWLQLKRGRYVLALAAIWVPGIIFGIALTDIHGL